MITLALILSFLGCLASGTMLSMLLLLVGAYISVSLWFISHGIIYTGLLYILVYIGAIVVLIMFVVQLTNTSLSGDVSNHPTSLILIQNTVLIITLTILLAGGYSLLNSDFFLNFTYFNLTDLLLSPVNLLTHVSENTNNLLILASSIFNEYAYLLMISVHAIILAVIGPIKLALNTQLVH